jgi:hypothetical protein
MNRIWSEAFLASICMSRGGVWVGGWVTADGSGSTCCSVLLPLQHVAGCAFCSVSRILLFAVQQRDGLRGGPMHHGIMLCDTPYCMLSCTASLLCPTSTRGHRLRKPSARAPYEALLMLCRARPGLVQLVKLDSQRGAWGAHEAQQCPLRSCSARAAALSCGRAGYDSAGAVECAAALAACQGSSERRAALPCGVCVRGGAVCGCWYWQRCGLLQRCALRGRVLLRWCGLGLRQLDLWYGEV